MNAPTSEGGIQSAIRTSLGLLPHVRLFRNNRGVAWMGKIVDHDKQAGLITLANARPVEFGLTDGASDLIGLVQIVITPEMVGQRVALFGALEVKRADVKAVPEHQQRFVNFINAFGGRAGVVRSVEDALGVVGAKMAGLHR